MKAVIVSDGKKAEPKIEWNAKNVILLAVSMAGTALMILLVGGRFDQNELDAWVKQSADWVATEGQVIDLSPSEYGDSRLQKQYSSWTPAVKYVYFVNGARVNGHTIGRPALSFSTRERAEEYLTRFKKLGKVTVYYDPKMVTRSCLVKGERLTADTTIPQRD